MDVIVIVLAMALFWFGSIGHALYCGILALFTFTGYLVYLSTARSPLLLYRPQFRHWHLVLAAWFAVLIFTRNNKYIPAIATGAICYYYACISLYERTVRYVPWANGFSHKTVHAMKSPKLFWTRVSKKRL